MENVGDTQLDVNFMSDNELRQRLLQLGANIGPVTDATRAVYQRKLQRWLQCNPATVSATLKPNDAEPHVEVPPWLPPPDICNSHSNGIDVGARNGPTASGTTLRNFDDRSTAAMAMGSTQNHKSSVRVSRSEVIPQQVPGNYSLTFAECGSGLTDNVRISREQALKKPKSEHIDQPFVTADDIEAVDRVLGMLDSATQPASLTDTGSSHINRDDEGLIRRRYTPYSAMARPSLDQYKDLDGYDGPSLLPDLDDYRVLRNTSRLSSASFSSPADTVEHAVPRRYCDSTKLVYALVIAVLVALFVWAVVRNMEPAFVSPIV